jgi:transcriptional repressor NrdR
VERIVDDLANTFDREVSCEAIGERVMAGLRGLDPVAYVRYASVYRRFEEATDFVAEVKKLEKKLDTLTARLPGI